MELHPNSCLIATLGSEPQVVTAVLDLLAAQGETIALVQVIHTQAAEGDIAAGLERLRAAFALPPYGGRISLELFPVLDDYGAPFGDVETPQAAGQVFRLLYRVVRSAKQAGRRVHLSIAGGRKSMAIFGMAVAQMLFDEADCLWHLHSSGDFLHSKRLHPLPGDQAHLIAIPVVWWSPVSPALLELGDVEDPFRAVERLRLLRLDETMEQSRAFVLGSLSPAEERAVSLLVREGLSDAEIAGRLVISPRTVEHHLREAYRKAALHWGAGDINRAQLVALLNFYYKLRENPHDRREKSR